MKNEKVSVCPGCKKHCPLSNVRCKYGRNYIEKMEISAKKKKEEKTNRHKWEKYVSDSGMLHELLSASGRIKRALRDGKTDEPALIGNITAEEQEAFEAVLKKLSGNLPDVVSDKLK